MEKWVGSVKYFHMSMTISKRNGDILCSTNYVLNTVYETPSPTRLLPLAPSPHPSPLTPSLNVIPLLLMGHPKQGFVSAYFQTTEEHK